MILCNMQSIYDLQTAAWIFFGEFVGDCGEGVRNGLAVAVISQNIFIN